MVVILSSRAAVIPCPLLSHLSLCVLAAGPGDVSVVVSGSSGELYPGTEGRPALAGVVEVQSVDVFL